jgi:ribosomal protein S18 acetylase RimI-like enzyme
MTDGAAELVVRRTTSDDAAWIADQLRARWGSVEVVSRGRLSRPSDLPGFVAMLDGRRVGLATYRMDPDECELVTLDALEPGHGVGSALVDAVADAAGAAGCRRMWLITTNDNTPALRFYQRNGLQLAALHRDAVEESRRLKPQISLTGIDGIPIRDELELELLLTPRDEPGL